MDEQKELKAFRASERQSSAAEHPPVNVKTGEWREFPFVKQLVDSGDCDALLEKCDVTCKRLDEIVGSGSEEEKTHAQSAMNAYGRSLDLLAELAALKAEMSGTGPK